MDREQTKKALPILQAFAEGKIIQWTDPDDYHSEWIDMSADELEEYQILNYPEDYRIKPEPQYRPFKDTNECWEEMQKHQPFGWLKNKKTKEYELLRRVAPKDGVIDQYTCVFERCVFADGTPFGIKEE